MSRKSKIVIPRIHLQYEPTKKKTPKKDRPMKKMVAQPHHIAEYMELIPKKGTNPLVNYRKGGAINE